MLNLSPAEAVSAGILRKHVTSGTAHLCLSVGRHLLREKLLLFLRACAATYMALNSKVNQIAKNADYDDIHFESRMNIMRMLIATLSLTNNH